MVGFITVGGGPLFFVFFDAADKVVIGRCGILSRKTHTITQKARVSVIVCKICSLSFMQE